MVSLDCTIDNICNKVIYYTDKKINYLNFNPNPPYNTLNWVADRRNPPKVCADSFVLVHTSATEHAACPVLPLPAYDPTPSNTEKGQQRDGPEHSANPKP